MRIAGSRVLAAGPDVVFAAIHDPAVLLACIPGCRDARRVSAAGYEAELALRLPAITGTYRLAVQVVDAVAPVHCRLDGRLEGRTATITGEATLDLAEADDGTRLDYLATGRIDGPLAWLDSSTVERLGASLLDQGLERLDRTLAGAATGGGAPEPEQRTNTHEEASRWA